MMSAFKRSIEAPRLFIVFKNNENSVISKMEIEMQIIQVTDYSLPSVYSLTVIFLFMLAVYFCFKTMPCSQNNLHFRTTQPGKIPMDVLAS